MEKVPFSIYTSEIEPNIAFLPYVTAAFATLVLTMLMLWGTGKIKPSEYGPGAKKDAVSAPAAH